MAGRGAPPKPAHRRARKNKDTVEMRVVEVTPSGQPELPDHSEGWHPQTLRWWEMWGESPLAAEFTANDWNELSDTAVIHSAFWNGAISAGAELRLRVAKFGATPEDRARLRITFAAAEQADELRPRPGPTSNSWDGLKVLGAG